MGQDTVGSDYDCGDGEIEASEELRALLSRRRDKSLAAGL